MDHTESSALQRWRHSIEFSKACLQVNLSPNDAWSIALSGIVNNHFHVFVLEAALVANVLFQLYLHATFVHTMMKQYAIVI